MRRHSDGILTERETHESLTDLDFDVPAEKFLEQLLATQCRTGNADRGAVLRITADGTASPLSVYPRTNDTSHDWLALAAKLAPAVATDGKSVSIPLPGQELYGQPNSHELTLIPITGVRDFRGVAAFVLEAFGTGKPDRRLERLELSTHLFSLYEARNALKRRDDQVEELQTAMEVVASINERHRFLSAAMGFCNEVASRWQAERASIGFLQGRYVVLRGMSHTERFDRRMELVQELEAVMEECLDQDIEVVHPAEPEAAYISRMTEEFAGKRSPLAICSLPVRYRSEVRAVLTVERSPGAPWNEQELRRLRLTCELCSPRLLELYEHDRWFGARAASALRRGLAVLIGPTHTWAKLTAVLTIAAACFLTFVKGDYRAEAPFVVQATQRQLIVAPFDGYLKEVSVAVGDFVEANDTSLAVLDASALSLELAADQAERAAYLKRGSIARREANTAETQIADAEAAKITARIHLLEYKIDQASIRSGISGIVVTGDLERRLGAPVATGDILFEVAPLESLRVELAMPEDQIVDVRPNQTGYLATASYPGDKIPFTVERINPMADVVAGGNTFKVYARLEETRDWLRPGMAGTAKIDVDRRSYGWIWTRRLVNWIRMKLWI